ncbi:MAG: hypothetical protein ACFBSF_18380 [Leptolyngbyaceae cyanobacterium]
MAPVSLVSLEIETADTFKKLGITYWQKLVREGVPRLEAQHIAAAIAKFDLFERIPSLEQKHLISKFSASVCRAQLWRSHLLL